MAEAAPFGEQGREPLGIFLDRAWFHAHDDSITERPPLLQETRMNRLFLTAAAASLAALTACSNAATSTAGSASTGTVTSPAEDAGTVVATIGSEKITMADLDKELRGQLRALDQEMMEQKHRLRQQGLEALIAQRLVAAEAKKKGVPEEEMLRTHVESLVQKPTDEEIKAFYDSQAGMPGLPPFDDAKERIASYLLAERNRKVMFEFFDKLKSEQTVTVTLPEPQMPKVQVAATGPSKGPDNAKVTIVTFSDFECPFCSRVNPALEQVMEAYEGQVRIVFRDFPLAFHANAPKAAEAAHCAHEQGKFWDMHDKLFANQKALQPGQLKGYAGELGLDQAKFDQCLDSGKMAEVVKKNMEEGAEAGVQGTPAFFVNGTMLSGALPFEEFKKVIDQELGVGATASK